MLRNCTIIASLPLLLLASAPVRAQDAPAATASGFPSEGVEDLSATTSQSGSLLQTDWNLLSTLRGTALVGAGGEDIGELSDVLLDDAGRVQGLVVQEGGSLVLGRTRHLVETGRLPMLENGNLSLPLTDEQAKTLAAYEEAPRPGVWPAAALLGAEIDSAEGGVEIADLRFGPDGVDRIILEGGDAPGGAREIPFSDIAISGEPGEPQVVLTEEGQRRLGAFAKVE
jgi:hypothetical protein